MRVVRKAPCLFLSSHQMQLLLAPVKNLAITDVMRLMYEEFDHLL